MVRPKCRAKTLVAQHAETLSVGKTSGELGGAGALALGGRQARREVAELTLESLDDQCQIIDGVRRWWWWWW